MSTRIKYKAQVLAILGAFGVVSLGSNAASEGIFDVPKPAVGWVKISTTQVWKSGSLLRNSSQISTPIFGASNEFFPTQAECEVSLIKDVCPSDISQGNKQCSLQNSSGQSVVRIDDRLAAMGQDVVTKFVHCQEVRVTTPVSEVAFLR